MLRKYVSLFLLYSLLLMALTGTVLFTMPHGRVAYWTGWRFLGLDKDQWDNLHIIFGFLMVFFGIWHVALNWRSIVNYLKGKAGLFTSKEFLVTTFIVFLVGTGTLLNVSPFKNFIDFGEKIRNSWPKPKIMPPAPHAELFPLKRVAQLLGITPQQALNILKSKGLKVSSTDEALKEIAARNGTTPARVYEILSESVHSGGKSSSFLQPGSGLGRMTLKDVCRKLNIPLQMCLSNLQSRGISAKPDETLREIAFRNNLYPYQLIEILQGGK